ncbi:hypothetical protein SAMN05880570_3399 [Paenibacillus sp. RU4T]|nr:hypothetical protein SAMN05880555_3398 [Paenibacillus sp. RU4X]SIR41747.1 hypothetical protein SAMN05880570_3399 [Paenibacillus sp. RU4T]
MQGASREGRRGARRSTGRAGTDARRQPGGQTGGQTWSKAVNREGRNGRDGCKAPAGRADVEQGGQRMTGQDRRRRCQRDRRLWQCNIIDLEAFFQVGYKTSAFGSTTILATLVFKLCNGEYVQSIASINRVSDIGSAI